MIPCIQWLLAPVIFSTAFTAQGGEPLTKRVEVDKSQQVLRAYEGDRLVFQTRISTGKWDRSTPNGNFTVGVKHRFHYSKRYHNAPMPFAVQVNGHIFIHGYTEVPARPASHGCIRVPLDGDNPAQWFFNWAEPGTPVEVMGRWEPRNPNPAKPSRTQGH
jgi:lipoprotein-anchoring transpeptidase ErfK/SrfK